MIDGVYSAPHRFAMWVLFLETSGSTGISTLHIGESTDVSSHSLPDLRVGSEDGVLTLASLVSLMVCLLNHQCTTNGN